MKNYWHFLSKRQRLAAGKLSVFLWSCLMLLSLNPSSAHADPWQSHKSIYQAINQYALDHLGGSATSTQLDERSRYALCKSSLVVSLPFNNHKTIKVDCAQSVSSAQPKWSLYISIKVQSSIMAWRLLTPIAKHDVISASQVQLQNHKASNHNFLGVDNSPVGKQVKRGMDAGHWLNADDFTAIQTVWRAASDLRQGVAITEQHLQASPIQVSVTRPNLLTDKNQILGQLAKRYIKAGKILDTGDIEGQQRVLLASQPLAAGRALIVSDMQLQWLPNHKLRSGGFSQTNQLVGWVTKRHIPAGAALTKDMLRTAYMVIKSNQVSLQINRSNYQITSTAQALANGNLGDKIDVKVLQSGQIKQAVVIGKGQVELLK